MTAETDATTADVCVVGSGVAGCAAALAAARAGQDVLVVTKAERPEDATSWWAQGGVAVSRANADGFKQDIIAASDGAADPGAVDVLVENANDAVRDVFVETLDVPFDTGETDEFDYGREAAHGERRILHVNASTGRHVLGPFLSHLDDHPNVELREDTAALDLTTREGRVHGAAVESDGTVEPVYAGATVLATGGIGALYGRSTNPDGATADGVAMAALAGADITDMEYVQFHPTAYAGDEPFLLSEAVRGEGALLRNDNGERFMPDYHPNAELAPRDVVARAVARERDRTGDVRLDVSPLDFGEEFPDLAAKCDERSIDWQDGIPVAPAEHFLCGGIDVDSRGRASLDRLFAVGECARTGVHGANRLASTSLLEGLVWGLRAGRTAADGADPAVVEAPDLRDSDPALPESFAAEKFARLRQVMDEFVGLSRTPDGLRRASAAIRRLKGEVDAYARTRTSRDLYELRAATVTALLIVRAANENTESRGCHHLVDDADTADASEAHAGRP
jgi:L-aspartate oxidase